MTSQYSVVGLFEELTIQGGILATKFEGSFGEICIKIAGVTSEGYTEDIYGVAIITNFLLNESSGKLSFTKRYVDKKCLYYYSFTFNGSSWSGMWQVRNLPRGIITAQGNAWCHLVEGLPTSC